MSEHHSVPVVLSLSGHDPVGGAGVQADIEAIASVGCHGATIITCLTVQDTVDVKRVEPVESMLVMEQARAVLEDLPVAAIKIGLLGSVDNIEVIHSLLQDYPRLPVVLDPVLASGAGSDLVDEELIEALHELLLPGCTMLTPNTLELERLVQGADNTDARAHELLDAGCEFVLVTGTHHHDLERHDDRYGRNPVVNILYGNNRRLDSYTWERLPHSYHGSGCTLASALAGLLAQGVEPMTAVYEAQHYTWEALANGYRIGMGQYIPNRLFWAEPGEEEGHAPEV